MDIKPYITKFNQGIYQSVLSSFGYSSLACGSSKKKIPRPKLKYLGRAQNTKHLIIAILLSATSAVTFRILYNERRIHRVRDFYANYDAEKHFLEMVDAGVLQSMIQLEGEEK